MKSSDLNFKLLRCDERVTFLSSTSDEICTWSHTQVKDECRRFRHEWLFLPLPMIFCARDSSSVAWKYKNQKIERQVAIFGNERTTLYNLDGSRDVHFRRLFGYILPPKTRYTYFPHSRRKFVWARLTVRKSNSQKYGTTLGIRIIPRCDLPMTELETLENLEMSNLDISIRVVLQAIAELSLRELTVLLILHNGPS